MVNITILDVNNNAPIFARTTYIESIPEDVLIGIRNSKKMQKLYYLTCLLAFFLGTSVAELIATDADTGLNAEIRYRIQKGSFDDFSIDDETGVVSVASKLDFDRRNTYTMEIIAEDKGEQSLTGTATLIVNVINTNDKLPYFIPTTQKAEVRD